ncbi:hypothetical protein DL766_001885 [Monosporascus sp. MC13-8B]|uniref:Glucose-methanol-choline oxidoreductase N-terminal domain-containing protein n=1 Tax=Monosporascus cannonballus TaxID=155416 RepID=A0ABY0GVJ8_9PEZI|nr:hypothetical protein DL762_008965 [Monosporascus cannonballus]RYO85397.1 hypothetical protein DL763_007113 [Monosporascus cannonballus]RYP36645.1 hypothetical protein DL766_001885 [Monosporascus sp. MC13-8B]
MTITIELFLIGRFILLTGLKQFPVTDCHGLRGLTVPLPEILLLYTSRFLKQGNIPGHVSLSGVKPAKEAPGSLGSHEAKSYITSSVPNLNPPFLYSPGPGIPAVLFKMLSISRIAAASFAAAGFFRTCQAQTPSGEYTDPDTAITYQTWSIAQSANTGAFTFGLVLPEDALTRDASEYIGLLQCSKDPETSAWCGISHGQSGQMTQALLLVAWPYEDQVLTSFRYATGYSSPVPYTGDAKLTQIASKMNETHFELQYRCENCFSWDHDGSTGSVSTSNGVLVVGRAAANAVPSNAECATSAVLQQHNNGFGQFGAALDGVPNESYSAWAEKATATVTGDCGSSPTPTVTSSTTTGPTATATCAPGVTDKAYDYVVVGAGAGGIPVADKLSEAGHSVLLIEKGPPSTGRWGGKLGPEWLKGTGLTRFDVPGLCNQIWVDSNGIACKDTDQMAGCVLGGGAAVNAGLWWKANPKDWDENFPEGWHNSDVARAQERVFSRIPGTTRPSVDGKLYMHQGVDVLSGALEAAGWENVPEPNSAPTKKNHTFGATTYMFANGERGGPLATYLVSAAKRENFSLLMNQGVRRAIRTGGHVTGLELDCVQPDGNLGVISLTPDTGRAIFAAGTFGSAKLLLRSGIGPDDQLKVVAGSRSDGAGFISESEWINLPVGYNLVDHTNTDLFITHPDIVFYDFYEAWDTPNGADKNMYLDKRSGILAQSAPNIGPVFWDEIRGADGVTRQLQYTARVEGGDQTGTNSTMIMSQYLGRGTTSRGRMTIDGALTTHVTTHPYLRDENDVAAVIQGIENLRAALKGYAGLTFAVPPDDQSTQDYVDKYIVSAARRRANHWMGTAKLGKDSGLDGGSSVVDLDTKVYGTDNLFVVDAAIFPGMVTGNPSAMIVTAAEYAAERMLALGS